jgi:hypothetical protein
MRSGKYGWEKACDLLNKGNRTTLNQTSHFFSVSDSRGGPVELLIIPSQEKDI